MRILTLTSAILALTTIMMVACAQRTAPSQESKPSEGITPSGYPYMILRDKEGKEAEAGDRIRFYITVLHNGNQLAHEDFTGVLPDISKLAQPKPETELLYLLSPGDSAVVFLTGDHLKKIDLQGLQDGDTISYHIGYIELVHSREQFDALNKKKDELSALLTKTYENRKAGRLGDEVIRFESGLEMVVHKEGDGDAPWPGSQVHVHFVGALSDGRIFTDTHRLGEPYVFNIMVGQVMKGWEETIANMRIGSIVTTFIPADLAYGKEGVPGSVPPDEDLIYTMEILKVVDMPMENIAPAVGF
jgi:FKBP-type peptidyl-prolyl cis-trans isomerase